MDSFCRNIGAYLAENFPIQAGDIKTRFKPESGICRCIGSDGKGILLKPPCDAGGKIFIMESQMNVLHQPCIDLPVKT